MENLSDAEFEQRNGFSREVLKEVERKLLYEKNAQEYGARMRGGYTTVEQEKAAKFLNRQEAEEVRQAKFDEMRKDRARWMWLLNPGSGDTQPVEILMDTGSDVNIMTEGMAKDYNLEMLGLPRPETFNLTVGEVTCRYRVEVSWMGSGDEYGTTEFYILPPEDARIEKPLLGFESIQKIQGSLLMECPRKTIAYTAMKKKTVRSHSTWQRSIGP
ncbi:hypothetical protein F5883DRAFT_518399 [Diaporthe sp. PMI_573]|nr:hypothetical protein F5883DRAFT_518399 [Diaporthaceae sp. PMI_573]